MSTERIERALKFRAKMWHKATSFRARPQTKVVAYRPENPDEECTYVDIPQDEAVKRAKEATKTLRYSYWKLAVKAGQTLLHLLCEDTRDNRPDPVPAFDYNGDVYVLQSVDGDTQKYIRLEEWNAEKVRLNPTSRRERIEREVITMREMQANDMLRALTPSEIDTEPEFA